MSTAMEYQRIKPCIVKLTQMVWVQEHECNVVYALDENGNTIIITEKDFKELYAPVDGSVVMYRDRELETVTVDHIQSIENDDDTITEMVHYLSRWGVSKKCPKDKFNSLFRTRIKN